MNRDRHAWEGGRDRREHRVPPELLRLAAQKAARVALKYPAIEMGTGPEQFPHYAPERVRRDMDDVARVEERWARDGEDVLPEGKIFESFMLQMIQEAKWFGDAEIKRTAKFDDYFNHIDALVRFATADGGRMMGLGFDATSNAAELQEKVERIIEHVRAGTLGTVRYAQIGDITGELKGVPEFVLFCSRKRFAEICDVWTSYERGMATQDAGQRAAYMQRVRELGVHPMRMEFLYQGMVQLQHFATRYAQPAHKNGGRDVRGILIAAAALFETKLRALVDATGMSYEAYVEQLEKTDGVRMLRGVLGGAESGS